MRVLVFDIETVPDVQAGRRLNGLTDLCDQEVAKLMYSQRLQATKGTSDFLPHYLQQIVAISVVLAGPDEVKVWSLGEEDSNEKDLITRFFAGLEKYTPTLVSWNGAGFDLPVLHYRALLHGVQAKCYWDTGEGDPQFKWNNYLNRFHMRHLDLMDVIAGYQNRAFAPLDTLSTLLGFPGKQGMSGGQVWDAYCDGKIADIRHYCETDVLNTYLVYLRFQFIRGLLTEQAHQQSLDAVQTFLLQSEDAHCKDFLDAWMPQTARDLL
jgi:predicted PolB exonuclease-like 3'-5' exonuclease